MPQLIKACAIPELVRRAFRRNIIDTQQLSDNAGQHLHEPQSRRGCSLLYPFDRAQLLAILVGAAGGAIAIASMEAFSARTTFPLVAIPFATSIVLALGSPKVEPAQPRALVGGHLVSTLVGLLVLQLCGPGPWSAPLAVALAMVAMHLTGTFHPPAGIDPLVVVVNDLSWSFLFAPVGLGALLLALFAFCWHNLAARGISRADTWPTHWW
jgi:CBS-domain-containing membrane protein